MFICVSQTGLLDRTCSVARSHCVLSVWGLVSICTALAYSSVGPRLQVVPYRRNNETGPRIYYNSIVPQYGYKWSNTETGGKSEVSVGPQLPTIWLQVIPQYGYK